MATLFITITHTKEGDLETIVNAQELSGGIGKNKESRPLDWGQREVNDPLFGSVFTKSRRANAEDFDSDFLKEGWSKHSIENGVVHTHGESNTAKSGKLWAVDQVCRTFCAWNDR